MINNFFSRRDPRAKEVVVRNTDPRIKLLPAGVCPLESVPTPHESRPPMVHVQYGRHVGGESADGLTVSTEPRRDGFTV